MLNEFTSYTSNLDATKNDSKVRDRGYCPNGTDIGRPVAGSLPIPPPSSSWNYPYLSNLYNYYNPNSYELGNVPQYDNQKCTSQYVRNYNEHSSRFHSTSVLQCCDSRCQLIAKHAKYPYHPVNTKINQHSNKRTKNYYSGIVDLPKPDASVTGLAPSLEHTKYTPCVPYPTLRNDLNGKYSNQPSEYCSPFTNTLKRGGDSTSFNEYYTDIGNPSYWNKPSTSIWNRNSSSSYYPSTFEDKNTQKIDQGNFNSGGSRGILFNRLLEHRDHPYDTGYAPNYYYGSKNDLNPGINYNQPNLSCESVISDNRLPLQTNSYQPPPAYNIHYPSSQTIPQYYKENTQKRVQDAANQESRILDKNPNLDVREFLSTWEDDVDDEKVIEPTNESPVIVLDCTNLEGDVLAKVKEKLNSNSMSNDDTAILKIVDVSNNGSATVLSPHTSVIQENAGQSKEIIDKSSLESSHMNSDGYMTWYTNGRKKEDFSYDLVEMTERLVNTVGKLLSDPEKKVKSASLPIKEPPSPQLQDSHSRLLPRPLPALPVLNNNWNPNSDSKKNVNISNIPPASSNGCLGNVSAANNISYNNYTPEIDRNQQPLSEKNVSCTFNLRKTSNDLKFSVNYSTQQNDYNMNKASDLPTKFKSPELAQPYYEYNKLSTANPTINASNYKSYSTYSSYYENTGCNYDQIKLCTSNSYNAAVKDNSMNYVDHIEKHAVSDTDITLVKADLEKSLNEISHNFKSNNNAEKNCQYFDSNCLNTTEIIAKSDESSKCDEKNKIIETQTYNGVIQKTGICNSPLQNVDGTNCLDNLLSMPSLSPPPNSSSTITQPVISSSSVSQNKEQPLCGINLTLTDMYENEDTIFNTSQGTETNAFVPFCSGNLTPNDLTYQPLNLAVSRDTKPQESSFKDQIKMPEDNETNRVLTSKTNSKADDSYYSVENAELDENSGSNSKKSGHSLVSVAYHPCIVSHEQSKLAEIQNINQSASETISNTVPPPENQQDEINVRNLSQMGENCNSDIISSDNGIKPLIEPNKEINEEISSGILMPDKSDEIGQIQAASSINPVISSEDTTEQNDSKNNGSSDHREKLNEKGNTSTPYDSSNLENASTQSPQSEIKFRSHIEKNTELGEVKSVETTECESIQNQKYEQEDMALNLKVQPDIPSYFIPCGSVIKENENFIHHTIKENPISLPCLENETCEVTNDGAAIAPKPSYNSYISIIEKHSPKSVIVDNDLNSIERDENCTRRNNDSIGDEVKPNQPKRKLIDTSISNTNLPMKKRRGQEYLTEEVISSELIVPPAVLISSVEDSAKDSHHLSAINVNLHKDEPIPDIPRKNKKKRKKDKSKNSLKHRKYSKFKRHPLSKKQLKYRKRGHLLNRKDESPNSMASEIIEENNAISSSSSSPNYDNNNDDMFNIPSIAPTPQFDLIQDFEPQKEQFDEESTANFKLSRNSCKSDFISSSIDLHMMKAPSPNCILQDESFISEKSLSKAPSPYYDYNYEGVSPSSVAPSPNYDIIEGVLFDDTDSSRNNEDDDCKNKSNLELGIIDKHANSQIRFGDFQRPIKYSITENEYESDYEIDRYYSKCKRDNHVKRLLKKSKNFLSYNHHENKRNNHKNAKFSVNIFRHFDYAVDDERCIRSEDDEYEPRPNHIRHAFKPKSIPNSVRIKDNGKHVKKNNVKYSQRDKKRIVDSECDLYFNKKKSTYINSPDHPLPASVSSQCDKIISKFQMIEVTRSNQCTIDKIIENEEISKKEKLNCRSPLLNSRHGSDSKLLSNIEEDEIVSSPAHVGNSHSPTSIIESDAEISDSHDSNKSDTNYLLNSQDVESPVDSIVGKEFNIIEKEDSLKSDVKIETYHSSGDEHQSSNNYSYQPSPSSSHDKISPVTNIDTTCKDLPSAKSSIISDYQESTDQVDSSLNEQSAQFLNTNQSIIKTYQYSPTQPEENICKQVNDGAGTSLENQLIPTQIEKDQFNIPCIDHSTIAHSNEASIDSQFNESISNNLPDIPSKDVSCTELNDTYCNIGKDENISPSNLINTTRIKSLNSDEDDSTEITLQRNNKCKYDETTSEISPVPEKSLPETDDSFHESTCSIIRSNSNNLAIDDAEKNDLNTSSKIEKNELISHQSISPIPEEVDSSAYPSNSLQSMASPGDEIKKSHSVKNRMEMNNSINKNKHTNSNEKAHELDNIIGDNQAENEGLENESVSSLNETETDNILDITPDTGNINNNIHFLDPVIPPNICYASPKEITTSPDNHSILGRNLSKDSSSSKHFFSKDDEEVEKEEILDENEVYRNAILSSEPKELNTSTILQNSPVDVPFTEERINICDSSEPVDNSDEVASNLSETCKSSISDKHSPLASFPDDSEEINTTHNINTDTCQSCSPLSIHNGDSNVNKLSDFENYSHVPVLNSFNNSLEISDCNDNNICKIVESYRQSSVDTLDSHLDPDHQIEEDSCTYSNGILFDADNSDSPCNTSQDEPLLTGCNGITEIAMETGLCGTSNYLDNEVPTLRFLAIKALSKATINNNLLEVRETPERTEIIIHSDEHCDPADFEDADSSNLIMTDTFDDDTHVSPNFEALQEMTFDYSTLPESTSSGYEEKNDEDLPCQCLIISSEESILCLRCSLNSSVDANQFHEMVESCEVSVSNLPDDTPTNFDCVEGNCIEQSFIDQEIDFSNSPVATFASVDSSPCPPVVESTDENITVEKTQIKVQLPWHRIFNLGGETNHGDNVESNGVCRQKVLELGPAQIEVRMLSDDCSWWKNSSSSGNSSPVVKVKRLVLQRAAAEAAAAAIEAEESNSKPQTEEQELAVPPSEVESKRAAPKKSLINEEDGERTLNEILGVPKMVIRKTSCRQYKSYLRTHRILQPVVRLKKNKWLDELALKYQQDSEPLSINAEDIEPKSMAQDAVTIELGEEIVTGTAEEVEVSQEISQEPSEEENADIEAKEEIVAGVSEEIVASQEISQEVSHGFSEKASSEVGRVEEIVPGASEGVEVGQQISQEFSAEATVEVETENDADEQMISGCENELTPDDVPVHYLDPEIEVEMHNTQTDLEDCRDISVQDLTLDDDCSANQENPVSQNTIEELPEYCSSTNHFLNVRTHLSLRSERHHCMLCHLSYSSVEAYRLHLRSRFHRHLELMQRETVHALYRRFTGRPCPSLRPLSAKERKIMKWKPRNADVNHFYHYKAPLQIALQSEDSVYSSGQFSFTSR